MEPFYSVKSTKRIYRMMITKSRFSLHRVFLRSLLFIIPGITLLIISQCFAVAKKPLVLAADTVTPRVLVAPDSSESQRYAAQELAEYLGKITGKTIETITSSETIKASAQSPVIIVGHHPANRDLNADQLGVEESVISVEENRVRIVGGKLPSIQSTKNRTFVRDRGTLYGVYNFLDDLGVRWYRPEPWGEHVPRRQDIVLEQGTTRDKPGYQYRTGMNIQRWWPDRTEEHKQQMPVWAVRNRQNVNIGGAKYGGSYQLWLPHAYSTFMHPGKYFKTHPEYFALVNGQRAQKGQPCMSNSEVQRIFAENVIAYAKTEPHIEGISLTPNDSDLFCECEPCRAMDAPLVLARNGRIKRLGNASMGNRVATFNNIIAKKVGQELPGVWLSWLAYAWHSEVPTKLTKLEPNTMVLPTSMAAAYGNYSKLLHDPAAKGNANLVELFEGYSKLGTMLGAREYWSGGWWYGPLPLLTVMKDRLTEYRKYGTRLVNTEFHPNWGPQTIQYYFYGRLLWNPDLDLDKEMEEFCRNYYGPAVEPMLAYHRLLEKASLEGPAWFQLGTFIGNLFDNDALIEQMTPLIEEARKAVADQELYAHRVHGDWLGYEVARRFNLVMRYKKAGKPVSALNTWDELGKFIQQEDKNENFNAGPVFFKTSWGVQERLYGINGLRSQVNKLKSNPSASLISNLDDDWKFCTDPQKKGVEKGVFKFDYKDENWSPIRANADWASQGHNYWGTAWYRKKFSLDKKEPGKRYVLFFGAVDGDAVIYLNGAKVGEHLLGPNFEGYNDEFLIDITDQVKAGENLVAVQVTKEFAIAGITKGVSLMRQ